MLCVGLDLVKCLTYMYLYESGYCCGRKFGNMFQGPMYSLTIQGKCKSYLLSTKECPQQLRMGPVSSPSFQEKYTRGISTGTETDFPSHT